MGWMGHVNHDESILSLKGNDGPFTYVKIALTLGRPEKQNANPEGLAYVLYESGAG